MSEIILNGIKVDDLVTKISQVFDDKLRSVLPLGNGTDPAKLLSRREVSKLLRISLPTLNDWTKQGWLKSYKLGRRVLYKQLEVEEALSTVTSLKHKKV
jgi:excisionase family DNA binding protein